MATSKIGKHKLFPTYINTYIFDNSSTSSDTVDLTEWLDKFDELMLIVFTDSNNGTSVYIPTSLASSTVVPISFWCANRATDYTSSNFGFCFQGYYLNGVITPNWVTVKGWTQVSVRVYGLRVC